MKKQNSKLFNRFHSASPWSALAAFLFFFTWLLSMDFDGTSSTSHSVHDNLKVGLHVAPRPHSGHAKDALVCFLGLGSGSSKLAKPRLLIECFTDHSFFEYNKLVIIAVWLFTLIKFNNLRFWYWLVVII